MEKGKRWFLAVESTVSRTGRGDDDGESSRSMTEQRLNVFPVASDPAHVAHL